MAAFPGFGLAISKMAVDTVVKNVKQQMREHENANAVVPQYGANNNAGQRQTVHIGGPGPAVR